MTIDAVIWDFGGVILSSPFEAFNIFEAERGLPRDFVRGVNSVNPDTNAWARYERNEIDLNGFDQAFLEESTRLGHAVRGAEIVALLEGELRPAMVEALQRCKARFKVACITNNVATESRRPPEARAAVAAVMDIFHLVIESSKVGLRTPDPRIYQLACEQLGVDPARSVYLDDLGINLKPARALGMQTIKVIDPTVALAELEAIVGFPLG